MTFITMKLIDLHIFDPEQQIHFIMTKLKTLLTLGLIAVFIITSKSIAQTPVIALDGVDDYVDLGTEAGNNLRTIELWFKPAVEINPDLTSLTPLIMRFTNPDNIDNFSLSFQPSSLPNSGSLRFNLERPNSEHNMYSDTTTWAADKWYHVAAVIHPLRGMQMFVDGRLQSDSDSTYTGVTPTTDNITTCGSWGRRTDLDRFFAGSIDDIRFSESVMYQLDFEPICPNIPGLLSSVALWNFNEDSGTTAFDAAGNNMFDAEIIGAERVTEFICEPSSNNHLSSSEIKISPNPASTFINLKFSEDLKFATKLFDVNGRIVFQGQNENRIHIGQLQSGLYFIQIKDLESADVVTEKIVIAR